MSKDNTERGKRRVTRTGGVPQVEWQTGRREGQPVRIDNVERESTTAEGVFFQDDDDEIYVDVHEKDNEEEVRQEKITNNNQKDDNGSDSEHEQDMDEDDTVEITTTKITQEDKETNGSTNIDRDEEKNAKMVRKQKAVVDLLQKHREDILRILAQQTEPLMFLKNATTR